VPELTESEATARAALIEVESYELVLDLTAEPVTSRTEVRFRCRDTGRDTARETFADVRLTTVREAVLNGQRLPGPAGGRLPLTELQAENVLTVEGDVPDGEALTWFEDPADGGRYVHANTFPANAGELMACFDQLGIVAGTFTLELRAPRDWECYANGPVAHRDGGLWRFGAVPGFTTYLLSFAAGPFASAPDGVRRRRSLPGTMLPGFAATAEQAREHFERVLTVPAPDAKYDILFVPNVASLAMSVPGLMLVNELLLAEMTDPDNQHPAAVCRHEVAHRWFGGLVTPRWWDDLWLDEALATYLECDLSPDGWVAFAYRAKAAAYRADALPAREPVSSPVPDSAFALDRPYALTYNKGASIVRQAAALIGDDALYAGFADYLTRFARRSGTLDDLVACWSRASGRDLADWADQWLRAPGAPVLRPDLAVSPDGTGLIESFTVIQDIERTHRIGIGLYDLDDDGRLTRRDRSPTVEISTDRTPVPELAGQPLPDAIVLNDGDLSYARTRFDDVSLRVLTSAAMRVGDPLTEAVGWNAGWDMVTSAELPAVTFADMACRRLRAGDLAEAAAETLTSRALACAEVWAPAALRARLREEIADACNYAEQTVVLPPVRHALASGFAQAAHSQAQLDLLRSRLRGDLDADLRAKATFTLAARGLATDEDLDALAALDPVNGERDRATARARRPDPAAKETAWQAALSGGWRLAQAHATGLWVPGQEELMAGYRDRYFAEVLPALARSGWQRRHRRLLTRLLFPVTLISSATIEACAPFEDDVTVAEQAAIMRQVLAARRQL
jgi:aminopeptidase N